LFWTRFFPPSYVVPYLTRCCFCTLS
jgi:hypothetical protein